MTTSLMTIAKARAAIQHQMPDPDCAWLDANLLLGKTTGWHQNLLATEPDKPLNRSAWQQLQRLAHRRSQGEPVAYILGEAGFMDLTLKITPAVMVPRPETEDLVRALLALPLGERAKILDLGTGSGAIALALGQGRPEWHILATDLSGESLVVAQHNSDALAINNICFLRGDWLQCCARNAFDAIVSNPPYIREDDPHLHGGGLQFEPPLALVGGTDGLHHIHRIVTQSGRCLKPGGWLLLEHGYDQSELVMQQLTAAGFQEVHSCRDLSGKARIALGRCPGKDQ